MKPYEQIRKYTYVNLWHLLPFTCISVSKFDASEQTVALLPLLVLQCSITSGLLIWGSRTFKLKKVRKVWIWMQAFITTAILWVYISELAQISKWLSITLHIGLALICFIAFYKMLIIGYDVPPMRNRTLEDPESE